MKRSCLQLPLRHRKGFWKWMSFALITVLSSQPIAFASERSVVFLPALSSHDTAAAARSCPDHRSQLDQ